MSIKTNYNTYEETPMFWQYLLMIVSVGKAALTGAGLALASLGGLDVAFALTAQDFLNSLDLHEYLNQFAIGGSLTGVIWHVASMVLTR